MDKMLIEMSKNILAVGREKGTVNQRFAILKSEGTRLNADGNAIVTSSSFFWEDNTACSAGLNYKRNGWPGLDAIASVSQIRYEAQQGYRDGTLTKEEGIQFYDILLNSTPYSECIVTKNSEEAYDLGLIIDTHHPSRLIAGATMAQRLAWEHTKIAKSILAFVNMGMHTGLAFLLGHLYSKTGQSVSNNWHVCVDSHLISPQYIRNFLMSRYTPDLDFNKATYYSRSIHQTWADGAGDDDAVEMRIAIAKYAEDMPDRLPVPNPFAKSFVLEVEKQDASSISSYFGKELGNILKG